MLSREEILTKKQKLGIDWATLARLDDAVFANGNDSYLGIARKRVIALKLLLFAFNPINNPPSEVEKKIVQDFLKSIRGNMEFSKELRQIAQMELVGKGNGATLIGKLITYIYKTRHFSTFSDVFSKFAANYNSFSESTALNQITKISLREYANVYDVAYIKTMLDEVANKGLLAGDSEFDEFYWQVIQAEMMIAKIEHGYRQPYNQTKHKTENTAVGITIEKSGSKGTC